MCAAKAAAQPILRRQTSADFGRRHVDITLAAIRLRDVREVLEQLDQGCCSCITAARAARAAGIVGRWLLNIVVALGALRPGALLRSASTTRVLALSELGYLTLSAVVALRRLAPLLLATARTPPAFCSWRGAAAAVNDIRPLASYSMLNHIPRVQYMIPGTWAVLRSDVARLRRAARAGGPLAERLGAAGMCLVRWLAFVSCEAVAFFLGLLSLRSKLAEVHRVTPGIPVLFNRRRTSIGVLARVDTALRWIPFLGFANQITGILDQEELRMDAVQRVAFAEGADDYALGDFNAIVLQELCSRHGLGRGLVLYLSLTSRDYQTLLLCREEVGDNSPPGESSASWHPPPRAGREMLLGRLMEMVQQLVSSK